MISNYDNLEIFYYTARLGSMSRTATELGVTPPTVTRTIQTLEQDMGCQLFLRSRSGIQLTDAGKELFQQIQQVMEVLEKTEEEILGQPHTQKTTISILARNTEWEHFLLPLCVPHFHEQYPDVCIRQVIANNSDLEEMLRSEPVDFAVCPTIDVDAAMYTVTPLYQGKEIFIVGEKYKDICQPGITLLDLVKLPLILVPEDQPFHIRFCQYMQSQGISVVPAIYVDNVVQQIIAVSSGLGYSVVSFAAAINPAFRGIYPLTRLPRPSLYRELICFIAPNSISLQPAVQALRDIILERAKELNVLIK